MNVDLTLDPPRPAATLGELRDAYLDQLVHGQAGRVEMLVPGGTAHVMRWKRDTLGYVLIHVGQTVIEYFVRDVHAGVAHFLLPQVLRHTGATSALVKTFDHQFLACALDIHHRVRVAGYLTRDFTPRPLPVLDRVHYTRRLADADDLDRVATLEQDVFTHRDRLREAIASEEMTLFERDGDLVGFGLHRRVVPDRPHVEVGLAVAPAFRRRGYAAYMLADLASACQRAGLVPITGTAVENVASMQLGVRVGFRSCHRLLRIEFHP